MAAYRYWRAAQIDPLGGGALELSEFHLYNEAVRVDGPATLTASTAPSSGALANLQDDTLSTGATWATARLLILSWDFGSATEVNGARLGSCDDKQKFPMSLRLQGSTDGVTWVASTIALYPYRDAFMFIQWPGARAMTIADLTTSEWSAIDANKQTTQTITLNSTKDIVTMPALSGSSTMLRALTPRSSGVRQFEMKVTAVGHSSTAVQLGIAKAAATDIYLGQTANSWGYLNTTGQKRTSNSVAAYGASFVVNDIIGVVVDFTAGTLTFYKNGTSQGIAYTTASLVGEAVYPAVSKSFSGGFDFSVQLICSGLTHPVGGATAWGGDTMISVGTWSGRTVASQPEIVESEGATPPYLGTLLEGASRARPDFITGGTGRITGTVKTDGTPTDDPVFRRVRCFRDRDGLLVQEQWSDPDTGAFDFQYLETEFTYTVIGYDHTGNFRAVVADNIVPDAMP